MELLHIDRWQALAIAVKTLLYASCFIACGGVFFLALFSSRLSERERRAIKRIIVASAAAGIFLSVSSVFVMSGMLSGTWSGMFDLDMTRTILSTRLGWSIALRLAGLGLTALACAAWARGRLFIIPLCGALLAIASLGVAGHANELSGEIGRLPQLLILLHLLAVAFWLGALWPLYLITRNQNVNAVAAAMRRFSGMAVAVVAVLVVAGAGLLWQLLGSVEALWGSAYGQMMISKLACVALLLLLAACNKQIWMPRLLTGNRSAIQALRRTILAEMLVAGLILLVTAGITTMTGPPTLA